MSDNPVILPPGWAKTCDNAGTDRIAAGGKHNRDFLRCHGPEQMLQSKAGYIDARPLTASSTKISCNARPDHTLGSKTEVSGLARHVRFTLRCRHRQPAPASPFGASAQSRCAPARCAGARAERPEAS